MTKEQEEKADEVRRKGEALKQYEEYMQNYQKENSRVEVQVFDNLFRTMIAEMFLDHAKSKDKPGEFIDGFFESFQDIYKNEFKREYVDTLPDERDVSNMMFASMFPSRTEVEDEIESSFHKAKKWYSVNIIRNFLDETAGKNK